MSRFSSFLLRSVPQHLSHSNQKKTTRQHYAYFSSFREPENRNRLEVEIISKEFIKPAAPTPEHSRMYEVSFLDQLFPNNYMPFIYFYKNYHKNESKLIDGKDLIVEKRNLLKQSLSETLTRFNPFAGRIKNNQYIECNDEGVYYVEARVCGNLFDFLMQPNNKSMHRLLPLDPCSKELLSKNYLAMIQVNVFRCGGIAIGLYSSHKIIDGYSLATFFKAWAATARNSPNEICPKFIASSIFPFNHALPDNFTILPIFPPSKTLTKRFVFPASSLSTLKKKADSSRVMALAGFLWKCAMAASKAGSTTHQSYFSLTTAVNLRDRSSPPMPPYCIGNIIWNTDPIKCSADEDLGLDSVVQLIKKSTDKINGDFIEEMKGERFALHMEKSLSERKMFYSDRNFKHMFMSSICNSGMYESDFGWGKPIWISFGLADTDIPALENYIMLMDTRFGNGIEALVTLSEQDMAVFERNPELLALASVNPCPLKRSCSYKARYSL